MEKMGGGQRTTDDLGQVQHRLAAPVVHRVALELAAREHGLDLLTSSQTEGLGNSHGAATTAQDPPARNPRPSSRPCRTRCVGTGT